jgi:NDP-sugar pyrophosphorylase family protein
MNNKLPIKDFFDLSKLHFSDIFAKTIFPWEVLTKMSDYLDLKINAEKTAGKYLKKQNILIGQGTIIEKSAVIKGRAIIGENCSIESASLIRENCIIGDNVRIGHGVELKNTLVMNNSSIAHLNYIGDSIVGNNVNISGGAIIANFRFDGREIFVSIDDQKISTGLIKFGAIIGDGSIVGVNAVLNPGTVLGKNCIVYPLTSVRGFHKSNEIIK